jgi:hypothetical protein
MRLGLPPPLVQDDVVVTGGRRGGRHPVGVEDGGRLVEWHPGGDDRPVGTAHHQRPHRANLRHQVTPPVTRYRKLT